MITLAFTQMLYYLGISIEEYGGDDGMRLQARSQFPLLDLERPGAVLLRGAGADAARSISSSPARRTRASAWCCARPSRTRRARARSASRPIPTGWRRSSSPAPCAGSPARCSSTTPTTSRPTSCTGRARARSCSWSSSAAWRPRAGPVLGAFALLLVEDMLRLAAGRLRAPALAGLPRAAAVLSVLFFRRGLAGLFGRHDG